MKRLVICKCDVSKPPEKKMKNASDCARYPSAMRESFIVRMPDGMRDMVREMAVKNHRSMNSEFIHLIEVGIEREVKNAAR